MCARGKVNAGKICSYLCVVRARAFMFMSFLLCVHVSVCECELGKDSCQDVQGRGRAQKCARKGAREGYSVMSDGCFLLFLRQRGREEGRER